MSGTERAPKIRLLDFHSPQMRAFHMAWFAFFLCFFGWFGIAPLMPIIRDELHLSKRKSEIQSLLRLLSRFSPGC